MEWIGTGHPDFIGYFWPIWTLYFKMSCSPGHRILKKAVLSSKIKCSLANMTLFLCLCSMLVFVLKQMWDELTHPLFASYYLKKKKKKKSTYRPSSFLSWKGKQTFFFLALMWRSISSSPIADILGPYGQNFKLEKGKEINSICKCVSQIVTFAMFIFALVILPAIRAKHYKMCILKCFHFNCSVVWGR